MPSSLIFVGLVVVWLLILVPAIARHQQEVARPSVAALSGRVLDRVPRRRRTEEVDVHDTEKAMTATDAGTTDEGAPGSVATRVGVGRDREDDGNGRDVGRDPDDRDVDWADEVDDLDDELDGDLDDELDGDRDEDWERPAPRYRPGRGGFDPEAAAIVAKAKYRFRQRVVLVMAVVVVLTGVIAALWVPVLWWVFGVAAVCLAGYLVYLRRQVRLEESIRVRRTERAAGTRRSSAADDPELDAWVRRGQEASRHPAEYDDEHLVLDDLHDEDDEDGRGPEAVGTDAFVAVAASPKAMAEIRGETAEPAADDPAAGPAREQDHGPALPRLAPTPAPEIPAGATVVTGDLDDDLHQLDGRGRGDHRRAAG